MDFGDPIPAKAYKDAAQHSRDCDLFIVVGSSLVVHPAAGMPEIAYESGAKLVIINAEETPFDDICHLRFWENISAVLPKVVSRLKKLQERSLNATACSSGSDCGKQSFSDYRNPTSLS